MAIIGNIINLIEEDLGAHARKSGKWFFWHCPFHTGYCWRIRKTDKNGIKSENS